MNLKPLSIATISIFVALLFGCGTQQYGDITRGYQLNECNSIPDNSERMNCLNRTNAGYDKLKQEKKYGNNQ